MTTAVMYRQSGRSIEALQRISQLIDQNQSLTRQLKYTKQQLETSGNAGTQARARAQRHAQLVVRMSEEAQLSSHRAAPLQAPLAARASQAQNEAERIECLESQVRCLQEQLHRTSAAEYRARQEYDVSRVNLHAAQQALATDATLIGSLQQQLRAERSAAPVRAAGVHIRATMQAHKAVNGQAGSLAAQNAVLHAQQQALLLRLTAAEQKLHEKVAPEHAAPHAPAAQPQQPPVDSVEGSQSTGTHVHCSGFSTSEVASDEEAEMSEPEWNAAAASIQLPANHSLLCLQKVSSTDCSVYIWPNVRGRTWPVNLPGCHCFGLHVHFMRDARGLKRSPRELQRDKTAE